MEPMIAASARQLAEENGLDWRRIKGSGTGGQINEGDVLDYLMRVMSGEEELPEGSVDPIPATLEQDMAAMRSMIAGSGMAEEGELDSLMASTPALEPMFAPEPILAQADQEMLEDEMLEDEMLGNEMSEEERMAAISAPAVDDSLEADDFDFDMEDPLAASAAVPLPSYEAAPEPMAASAEPKSVPAELPSFEPMVLEDVTPLSDEDLAALMGDPLPSASVLPDALPVQMAAPVLEDDFAASSPEQDELEEVSAASVALEPAYTEPAYTEPAYTEPAYTEPEQTDLEPEPMAASAVQDSVTDLEPLSAAPAVEDKPALEEDYAALAGVPVLSVPEPVPAEPVPVYIPASVPVHAPMASNRLSEVSLRVQFDVSALQEAALQLEPLIGQVSMAFFLARAVSRHAHLLGQSAVSHSRLSNGSYAPLYGIAGDFKAALEDYGSAAAGEALGIAVAYAGELGLEEASSAQAAYTVSLGKPFGETTGLTLRGEVSVQVGAAFLNAVADSLHKPITLLV